jgi:hypothetical protein
MSNAADALGSAALAPLTGACGAPCALRRGGCPARRLDVRLLATKGGEIARGTVLPLRRDGARALPHNGRTRGGAPCDEGGGSPDSGSAPAPDGRPKAVSATRRWGALPHLRVPAVRVPHVLLRARGISRWRARENASRCAERPRPPHRGPLRPFRTARPPPAPAGPRSRRPAPLALTPSFRQRVPRRIIGAPCSYRARSARS